MIDTSMYRIVRGEELLRSKGKEPPSTWQITDAQGNLTERKRSIGTHPHGISAGKPTPKHKQVSAGDWLSISATSAEYGDIGTWLDAPDYTLHGAPFEFAIKNIYAIDVLRGMGASFVLGAASVDGNKPIVFECGKRLALLMPMHISR